MTEPRYLPLSLPASATRKERRGFRKLCEVLSAGRPDLIEPVDHAWWLKAAGLGNLHDQPYLEAAARTAIDLVDQGWIVQTDRLGALFEPPAAGLSRELEKNRIRRQEHIRRDEQLRRASVRNFISKLERPRLHNGTFVSIFNLMRDGKELAEAIAEAENTSGAIEPYVQVVDDSDCEQTGIPLKDIWRYFRHTWSNAYASVPGRSMAILIRDAAAPSHPVIGIAAVSSPVVQIAERDRWIGWETDEFLAAVAAHPSIKIARWLSARVRKQLDEIYITDFLDEEIVRPFDMSNPTGEAIARLRADSDRHRRRHNRSSVVRHVKNIEGDAWVERARTDLFRSKRAASLADALEAIAVLRPYLQPHPTVNKLASAFEDSRAKSQLRKVVRRARGERVGTVIADLTVCGAIAPYSALAAGKLVAALAVSPEVLKAYREKYLRPSEIASAMAGRPITRETRLSFIGTTSLYGTGSSQYNRLFWPASVLGGSSDERIGYHELGRSRSFGTSHFSDDTVESLVRLSQVSGNATRVNSLFGEGVSPRLRKVRIGLATLGWPTSELLKHGRQRIVYGVPLVRNLRDFSLGIDRDPEYLFELDDQAATAQIAEWWFHRWGRRRIQLDHVVESMARHRSIRPVTHGARVQLPQDDIVLALDFGDPTAAV